MDARDIYNLYSAYRSVYEDREYLSEDVDYELDEGYKKLPLRRMVAQAVRHGVEGNERGAARIAHTAEGHSEKKSREKEMKNWARGRRKQEQQNEELDLYDVVLDHLLDEGYCDDVESAEIIMANMSEEWLDGILDEAKVDAGKSDEQKVVARRIRQGSTSSWDRDDSNRQANHRFRRNVTKGSSDYADPHGTYDRRPNTYKKEQEYVKKLSPEDREKRMEQNRRSIRRGR